MKDRATLVIPIKADFHRGLRAWLPKIDAKLWVEDASGEYREMFFRVDSGAVMTRITEALALTERLPIHEADPAITIGSLSTAGERDIEVRRGLLRVRFTPHEPGLPFLVPVQYVLTPPALGSGRQATPPLLGLVGVIEQMTQHTDGRQIEDNPFGTCVLTDPR